MLMTTCDDRFEGYVRRADVLNRGFSGYNTRWALELLPEVKDTVSGAKLVTVFFGASTFGRCGGVEVSVIRTDESKR